MINPIRNSFCSFGTDGKHSPENFEKDVESSPSLDKNSGPYRLRRTLMRMDKK